MGDAGTARLTAALAEAGVGWEQVADCRTLAGGTFNTVHLVGLADDTRLMVKIPPGPAVPVLRYERGILAPRRCITSSLAGSVASRCPRWWPWTQPVKLAGTW